MYSKIFHPNHKLQVNRLDSVSRQTILKKTKQIAKIIFNRRFAKFYKLQGKYLIKKYAVLSMTIVCSWKYCFYCTKKSTISLNFFQLPSLVKDCRLVPWSVLLSVSTNLMKDTSLCKKFDTIISIESLIILVVQLPWIKKKRSRTLQTNSISRSFCCRYIKYSHLLLIIYTVKDLLIILINQFHCFEEFMVVQGSFCRVIKW